MGAKGLSVRTTIVERVRNHFQSLVPLVEALRRDMSVVLQEQEPTVAEIGHVDTRV